MHGKLRTARLVAKEWRPDVQGRRGRPRFFGALILGLSESRSIRYSTVTDSSAESTLVFPLLTTTNNHANVTRVHIEQIGGTGAGGLFDAFGHGYPPTSLPLGHSVDTGPVDTLSDARVAQSFLHSPRYGTQCVSSVSRLNFSLQSQLFPSIVPYTIGLDLSNFLVLLSALGVW